MAIPGFTLVFCETDENILSAAQAGTRSGSFPYVNKEHEVYGGPGRDRTDDLPGRAGTRSGSFPYVNKEHEVFGGPGRDRTDDLFHAMEARSQLRHRPTSGLHLFSPTGMKSSNQTNRGASKQVKGLIFPLNGTNRLILRLVYRNRLDF
jgi:hypothetical protein